MATPSGKKLAEYAQLLKVHLNGPLQPQASLVNSAAADVPVILHEYAGRDSYLPAGNPDPNAKTISTSRLVSALGTRGHVETAAAWAIFNLIKRGFLGAETATILIPETAAPSQTKPAATPPADVGTADAVQVHVHIADSPGAAVMVPMSNEPGQPIHALRGAESRRGKPRSGQKYVPVPYLIVWPTKALSDWWRHSTEARLTLVDQAAELGPVAESKQVRLFGPESAPIVKGRKKPPLSPIRYELVKKLIEVGQERASKSQLERITSDYWRALNDLKKSDPDWDSVIHFPGKSHVGYWID